MNQEIEEYPIRVAVVQSEMNIGGVENVIMNYYRHIDRDLVQFDFYVHENSPSVPAEEIEKMGGCIFWIPSFKNPVKYCRTLRKYFSEQGYLIVHIHVNTMSVFAQYSAWRAKVPVRITHSHSTAGKGEWKRNIAKYFLRLFSNCFVTHRCACTEYAGVWLFGKRHKKDIKIWKNAIDIEAFAFDQATRQNMREKFHISDDEIVVGHIGRFMPQKNQLFLVQIFNEIQKINPKSKLVMVGDGPEKDVVIEKVRELNLEQSVIFADAQWGVESYYQMFDAFLFPSLYEGLGMVAIEAQVSGLPVIVSSVVPDDVMLTDRIMKMSLKEPAKKWAQAVLVQIDKTKGRKNCIEEINRAGYEIEEATKEMTEWYIKLCG